MERTKKVTTQIPDGLKRTKKAPPVKIYDFVVELQKWIYFTEAELSIAKRSRIDTDTGPYFKFLVKEFRKGEYCNEEHLLGDAIKGILKNAASYLPR